MTQVAARRVHTTTVEADLRVDVETHTGGSLHGHLTGSGQQLTLRLDDPSAFAGRQDAQAVRDIAAELARRGLVVHVEDDDGTRLISVGDVRSPWWQRPFTRSRHLKVAAGRGLLAAARGRASRGQQLLPDDGFGAPPTPFPLTPTLLRRPVRHVTSTNDAHRGGGARLVLLSGDGTWRPENLTFWLQQDVVTIGSDPSCDVVLSQLAPVHAEVRHDETDEYVLVAHDPRTSVHGQVGHAQVLRTSARIELAGATFAFVREEFADHGRPHGGRSGGEIGYQRPQPRARRPSDEDR